MNRTYKCRLLTDAILACFEDGITIDNRTKQYIDACLPGISMAEAAYRISEAPDLDIAPLMDLIFFPDEVLQARLEPLLEAEKYDRNDEAAIVEILEAKAVHTTLRNPESRESVAIQVPTSAIAPFVRRLGISRHIPARLADTISDVHPLETATRLKVMLRNARFSFTGPSSDFLEAFIMGMDPGDKDFDACFELTLELLGEPGTATDPYRLLRSKTDLLFKARNAAIQFEKELRSSNMETLMHQGIRAPEISSAAAEEKIALLDRIGGAVAIGRSKAGTREGNRSSGDGELEPEDGPPILG